MSSRTLKPSSGSRTRYLILGLLGEGQMSGYDIARLTKLRFRFFWSESYGQIYPELRRLAAEGLVVEAEEGGPRGRRSWSLTASGRSALGSWLGEAGASDGARLETLLKVSFAFAGGPGTLAKVLREFREKLESDIADLEAMESQLKAAPDHHGNHRFPLMSLEFGLSTYRCWKDWAERCAEKDGEDHQAARRP
jgi:PadR family transcriptional regulator, regulatory protein AphA